MTTTMEEVERLVKKFVRLVAQEEENGWTDEEDALTKSQFEQYMEEYRGFFEVPLKLKECAVAGGADGCPAGEVLVLEPTRRWRGRRCSARCSSRWRAAWSGTTTG